MTMERSLLPLPQKKKLPVSNKDSSTSPSNFAVGKGKSDKACPKHLDVSKKKLLPCSLESHKPSSPSYAKENKSKLKESHPSTNSNFGKKKTLGSSHDISNSKKSLNLTPTELLSKDQVNAKVGLKDSNEMLLNSPGFMPSQGQFGALNYSNKFSKNSEPVSSKHSSLKSFSKHLPQFAKDVLYSKGCTSKVQPTYQKLDKFKFGDDLTVEELDMNSNDDGEGSPIYHELDPIGIRCSKHTYQSIGEIQEELSKLGSTPNIPEPRSAPPVQMFHFPTPSIPCQSNNFSPVTSAKTKSNSKPSFFSKMWQPKRSQKSNQRECKFINSMPLLLPKDSPEYTPDEAQHSPSLITFLGGARSQMGSISQPGSANLEKSGLNSSPRGCRVFTFEDVEIDNAQFSGPVERVRTIKKISPLSMTKDPSKAKVGMRSNIKTRVPPLALDSPRPDIGSNSGCYATLMFPDDSPGHGPRKCGKFVRCLEPHSKALHNTVTPPRLLLNQPKGFNAKTIPTSDPFNRSAERKLGSRYIKSNLKTTSTICNSNEIYDEKISLNPSGSVESLLSQDTLRSESPLLHQSPLHRSPYSSPSCGVRMAELRASSRKSDSKSPSPEPPHANATFSYHSKEAHFTIHRPEAVCQTTHLIKSPPRMVCKSPNRYMHTILEEEHSMEQVLCIETLDNITTTCSQQDIVSEFGLTADVASDQPSDDGGVLKTASSNPDMKTLRSASLSSDIASLPSEFFSSEDSISCPTTDSEISLRNEEDSGLLKRDQYYIKAVPRIVTVSSNTYEEQNPAATHDILEKMEEHLHRQQSDVSDKLCQKQVRGSKLRPPKLTYTSFQESSTEKANSTFQSSSSKGLFTDGTKQNGVSSSPKRLQSSSVQDNNRSHLISPSPGSKQTSLKYSKPLVSSINASSFAVHQQQPELVAVELKPPMSSHLTNNQASKVPGTYKSSKSGFGYAREHRADEINDELRVARHCQTIPAPTRGTSSVSGSAGFDSFPKSRTSIIHSHHFKVAPSAGVACDLNSSLSSSPTSSSSSMFSTVDSENEGLLLAIRKDLIGHEGRLKLTKEASNQSLDSKTTSSQNSNSESEQSRTSEKSRLVAPRTDASKCREKFNKIMIGARDLQTTAKQSESAQTSVSTDS